MIARITPGAIQRHVRFHAIAATLGAGLWFAGGLVPAPAATPASSSTVSGPPSVDLIFENRKPPRYPVEAIQEGEQGTVMLDLSVDSSGRITDVKVDPGATTASARLQQAAIEAARNWKFKTGNKDDRSADGVVKVPVTFSLSELPDAATAPIVLRVHIGADGSITDAMVDHDYPTSVSPELQAQAIAKVKTLKFNQEQGEPTMPSGWYTVPYSFGPGSASSTAPNSVEVRATRIR